MKQKEAMLGQEPMQRRELEGREVAWAGKLEVAVLVTTHRQGVGKPSFFKFESGGVIS
jgi:hypothetical protein